MSLSPEAIRSSWEAERASMRKFLLEKKRFNHKHVDRFIDTFIESMVFARLPCTSMDGILAAFAVRRKEKQDA